MQLEFTMLDPHIRTALLPVAGSPGEYSVTFRAPDRHGVFKFVVDYKRKGHEPFPQHSFHHLTRFCFTQMVTPPELDHSPRRSPAPRWVPSIPQRSMAVLCRCLQHQHRLRPVLRPLASRRRQSRKEKDRVKNRVATVRTVDVVLRNLYIFTCDLFAEERALNPIELSH